MSDITFRLCDEAFMALEEIRQRLGGQVTLADAIRTALGTELYLLRFLDEDQSNSVWIEQVKGKYRQKLEIKPNREKWLKNDCRY